MKLPPHRITAPNVPLVVTWFAERGGIAVWASINIANLGATWTTAATMADGSPPRRPNWQAGPTPDRIITDPADVLVEVVREVKRFTLTVPPDVTGPIKLTPASQEIMRQALTLAGAGAYYEFDARTHAAVIYVPESVTPLPDYPLP